MDVTEDELRELFGAFGRVSSLLIQRDEYNNSKGFGFVNFESPEDAERAVNQLHDSDYFGKKLFVSRAQKKSEREDELRRQHQQMDHYNRVSPVIPNTSPVPSSARSATAAVEAPLIAPSKHTGVNLYVKNLAEDVDDETLRREFSRYGQITSAKVMKDEQTGLSKGFGFVCFTSPEEATEAVIKMNGYKISTKEIYVALAQRKEDRRQLLESQVMAQQQQSSASSIKSAGSSSTATSPRVTKSLQAPVDQPTAQPLLTLTNLQMFSEETQRQMLGERIYAIV